MHPTRRVALVTGRSRGLGRAIAGRLAADGLAVAVNALHDDDRLGEVVATLRGEGGVAEGFPADVTDEGQAADLAAAVADALGPIEVLVLNATGPQPEAPLDAVRGRPPGPARLLRPQPGADRAGITVNTVAPGFVPVERHADVPDDVRRAYVASVPARRFGTGEEIAHAVSFFASEAAGFVTGQRLVVDGGRGLT